ncbi:SDR family oxidoreductase [Pseudomonas aeruginosa]
MNALLALPDLQPERLFVQSGDVRLAVHCWGAPDNGKPTLLMVHGYPDNHETWLPLIRQLAGRYRIVAYDVRGAGASDKPRWSRDYHLQRLSEDLQAVIRATSPDRPVHLLAHDWGSIQTWESVTDPQCRPLIASYTSISGPCLDHVGFWMREHLRQRSPKALKAVFGQLLHSWYIAFFHTPVVPELLWSAGLARLWPQFLKHAEGVRHPQVNPTQASDGRHGVKLYRGNFIRSLFRPRKRHTEVPVQLIVPTRDRYVGAQLFQHLSLWAPRLWRREASVGHWQLLAEPEQLAGWLGEFIDAQETGESPPALQRAQVRPDARSMNGKLVVVTGAGGGIGRSTLLSFAERGASLLAADLDLEAAERSAELARALGATAHVYQVDVGDTQAMETFAEWVRDTLGVPDVVVSNAGIGMAGPMLSECLRAELAGRSIGVTAVCPGFVDTGIVQATRFVGMDAERQARRQAKIQRFYKRRRLSPDTVGEKLVRAVERNKAVVSVGSEVHLGALQWRFAPWATRFLARFDLTS